MLIVTAGDRLPIILARQHLRRLPLESRRGSIATSRG